MKRIAPFILFVMLAAPAHADQLLVEYGWNQPQPVTLPAEYEFTISNLGLLPPKFCCAFWKTTVDALPYHEALSTAAVAEFNSRLTRALPTTAFFYNDGQNVSDLLPGPFPPFQRPFSDVWNLDPSVAALGFHAIAYVPQLGPDLLGYKLTRMERTINAAGQTIFFYGNVVPEPATAVLLVVGLCGLLRRPKR